MKAHGHQDRAYENNVRPTSHRVGCLDEIGLMNGHNDHGLVLFDHCLYPTFGQEVLHLSPLESLAVTLCVGISNLAI